MQNNKKCWVCGKEYYHCDKCEKINHWKAHYDTSVCLQIHDILDTYRSGIITKSEAKGRFSRLGITSKSDFKKYLPEVAKDINDIVSVANATNNAKIKSK